MRLALVAALFLAALATRAVAWPGQRLYVESTFSSPPVVYVFLGDKGPVFIGLEYDFQWTVNGQPRPATLDAKETGCIYHDAQQYSCDALRFFFTQSGYRGRRPVTNGDPEAFMLTKADYDTEYCFRFRRQTFNSHPDAGFSEWSCARTPGPPPRPSVAPRNPQATKLPASSGRGTPGPGAPFRTLVEWDAAGDEGDVIGYQIQRQTAGRWASAFDQVKAAHQAGYEAEVPFPDASDPDESYAFRVCAYNISGSTCSAPAHTLGRGWVDPALRADKAVRVDPSNEAIQGHLPSTRPVIRARPPGASAEAFDARVQPAPPVVSQPARPSGALRSAPAAAPGPTNIPICERAAAAAARNSPTAPSLDAQCRAAGGHR